MNWNGLELPEAYYKDDAVYIIQGDCRSVLPLIPDKSIDLVLTDPPYGVDLNYGDKVDDSFSAWQLLMAWFIPFTLKLSPSCILSTSKLEGEQWLWNNTSPTWRICWYKEATTTRCSIGFKDWETLFVYGRLKKQIHDFFFAQPTQDYRNHHPCPKPEAFALWLLSRLTDTNDLILDPFLGSGTIAYCAKKLNRKCIGIEIEEKYCEIAAKRCSHSVMRLDI